MWPSSKVGVKLSYGHDGSGIYVPNMNPEQPWQFARTHGNGYRFYESCSKVMIPPVQMDVASTIGKTDTRSIERNTSSLRAGYIPKSIISDYTSESSHLNSPLKYDPVCGKLMDVGLIRHRHSVKKGIAFVDGNQGGGNVVHFSALQPGEGEGPSLYKDGINVDMKSQVMQVQLWGDEEDEEQSSPFALVRTLSGTSLVKIDAGRGLKYERSRSIHFDLYNEIPGGREGHVHSTFSPYDWHYVGIIDDVGAWKIHKLRPDFSKADPIETGMPHASEYQHSSRWNRILWGSNNDTLILANRQHARYFDIRSGQHNEMYRCKYGSSRICDIVPSPSSPHDHFLLTSQNINWVDDRMPTRVVLSWDHFMSSNDTSLQLATCKIDEVAMVAIHSQLMQANIVYQFTQLNGLPVSADDPYYYLGNPELVTQSLALIPEESATGNENEKVVCSLRFSNDYGLIKQVLTTDEAKSGLEIDEIKHISPAQQKSNQKMTLYDFTELYKELFPALPDIKATTDDQQLKEFAQLLGERARGLHSRSVRGIYSLYELEKPEVLFEDLNELSDMIDQMRDHFASTTIQVFPLTYHLKTLFHEDVKNITDMYNHLVDLWLTPIQELGDLPDIVAYRRQKLAWHIAAGLALSCMGVQSQRHFDECTDDEILERYTDCTLKNTKLTPATKLLLSEWEGSSEDYQWFKFGMDEHEKQTQIQLTQQPQLPQFIPPSLEQQPLIASTPLPLSQSQPVVAASASTTTATPRRKKRRTNKREGFV